MRGLLFFCGYIVILLCWSLVTILTFPFVPLKKRGILCRYAYRAFESWLRLAVGIRVLYDYAEPIPENENYIIVANHQTAWDAFAMNTLCLPSVTVLKYELMQIPLIGWGLMTIDPIVIRRKNLVQSMRQIYEKGSRKLREGFHLVIFPQGTRVSPPAVGELSAAPVRLALLTNKPLLPVVHNSGELLSSGGVFKRGGELRIRIGPPIRPQDFGGSAGKQAIRLKLAEQMSEMLRLTHDMETEEIMVLDSANREAVK